jgi:hypothetical protein
MTNKKVVIVQLPIREIKSSNKNIRKQLNIRL